MKYGVFCLSLLLLGSLMACGDQSSDDQDPQGNNGEENNADNNGADNNGADNNGADNNGADNNGADNNGADNNGVEPSVLDTCPEEDFGGSPWMGPGVDAQGALVFEADQTYIVSATVLQLRSDDAALQQRFGELVNAMVPEMLANEGLVGVSLGSSATCGTARTLSVWRDMGSMLRFVGSDSHLAGVTAVNELSPRYKTTSWSVDGGDVPSVDWTLQREMLATVPTIEAP